MPEFSETFFLLCLLRYGLVTLPVMQSLFCLSGFFFFQLGWVFFLRLTGTPWGSLRAAGRSSLAPEGAAAWLSWLGIRAVL